MSDQEGRARARALIIMQVRSGQITATEGARRLGLSRKSYYEWEGRGLEGMLKALEDQMPGRPVQTEDLEKEELRKKNRELEQELELSRKTVALRDIQLEYERKLNVEPRPLRGKKKEN